MLTTPFKAHVSSVPLKLRSVGQYSMATTVASTVKQVETALAGGQSPRKPRAEGTIASVFASLSGEKAVALPDRFSDLKR
jgi:hypothetical protein